MSQQIRVPSRFTNVPAPPRAVPKRGERLPEPQAPPPLPKLPPGAVNPNAQPPPLPLPLPPGAKPPPLAPSAVPLAPGGGPLAPGAPLPGVRPPAPQNLRQVALPGDLGGGADEVFMIPGMQSEQITPADMKAAFKMIDVDRKFKVDVADLRQMLQLAGEKATDQEVHEMIRLIDHDGGGTVEYVEFFDFFVNPPPIFRNYDMLTGEGTKEKVEVEEEVYQEEAAEMQERERERPEDVERQQVMQEFTGQGMKPSEIKMYYQRFVEVDTDGSGMINYEEFLQVLQVEDDPLHRRLFQLFDDDDSGEISLREFIVGISSYTGAEPKDKLRFAFMMFDEDSSGFLDRDELIKIIKANCDVSNPSEQYLNHRADQIYQQVKLPPDAQISFERFVMIAEENPALLLPAFQTMQQLEQTGQPKH